MGKKDAAVTTDNLRNAKIVKVRAIQRAIHRADPLIWLEERLGESRKGYEWTRFPEYIKHKWDGDRNPLAEAWREIAKGNWVGIEAGTGTSKTYFLARVVLWFLDVHDDSLVVTSAPKEAQLKLHLWSELTKVFHKFKSLRKSADMMSLKLRVDGSLSMVEGEEDLKESWLAIGFVAGVGAEETSATKAQGFHRKDMLIICEETPGMPGPVMTAFQNTCTGGNNVILAVGNPDSQLDELHKFCESPDVKSFRVSAYDYPNIVLNREEFPGAVTNKSIERRKLKYGKDSGLFLSRVRGISPSQGEDSLIKLDWVQQCINSPVERLDNSYNFNSVGIDVSNSESGDKAALAFFKDSELDHVHEFHCRNATHLAYNLIYNDSELMGKGYTNYNTKKLRDYNIQDDCVGIDAVGVGVSTVNAFYDEGMDDVKALSGGQWDEAIPVEEYWKDGKQIKKPMYRFVSLRAQMYWELREDLRQKQINITITDLTLLDQLKKELITPKFDMASNTIAVEKKENIKKRLGGKSPNIADAVVYANWCRKGYRKFQGGLPIFGGG